MTSRQEEAYARELTRRHRKGRIFCATCFASTWLAVAVLAVLLIGVCVQAFGWLDWAFLTSFQSDTAEESGILAGLWGSFWLILYTGLISIPVGVGAAIYLEEFASDNRLTRLIRVNLANLAGVPSIVYGILGLTVFVRLMSLDRSVIAGAMTLSLLILPVIIVASQEALRGVPASLRHASLALGATQWQTVRRQVLPAAAPGILTGIILSISRAMGETAPLVIVGALAFVQATPGRINSPIDFVTKSEEISHIPFDRFTALPMQIYQWATDSRAEFQQLAAAGILVLLAVLLMMNGVAILIRYRAQKSARW
ncbi:MAG: phosphate ABC transporter permease PstA [Planctomycetaceae bacterium]